ncbi:conserved hypothetical protein [Arthrobacter sp. 9AX]|uniref:hypothetical protein n=1 Tax=Arthrobacter sp. 9AX TaxID=2653131 RepID=UPI0012EF4F44|nr:hypothetical protein [Arthrobacter sp. 9AX]VXB30259.1 conserved hypothetical protein [Arthrobacter sp. 9AX]
MDSHPNQFQDRGLSRRQFGLVLSGGAFLLLAGGTFGVVGRSPENVTTSVATASGTLTVVRAGRLARLDASGQPAFKSLAAAASCLDTGDGPGGGRQLRRASTTEELDAHGHDDEALEDPSSPEPVNRTWPIVVLLEVQLENTGARPVLFSPGQLRLRLSSSAVTITPRDSDRSPGLVAPNASEHFLISYLTPRDQQDMELDYSDEQQDTNYRLALPPLTTNEVRS